MSHARCEHGTIGDLCPQCHPTVVKLFPHLQPAPKPAPEPGFITTGPLLAANHINSVVAATLAGAFIDGSYAALRRAFERFDPLESAALALSVYEALPPDERDNFAAFVRRMAKET